MRIIDLEVLNLCLLSKWIVNPKPAQYRRNMAKEICPRKDRRGGLSGLKMRFKSQILGRYMVGQRPFRYQYPTIYNCNTQPLQV
jgi:hypothetical protein